MVRNCLSKLEDQWLSLTIADTIFKHMAVDAQIPALQEAFFRLVEKRPQTSSDFQEEEGGEVNVTPISDDEVRNRSEQTVDIIGGRLKQFASHWQCITSDPFILNSVKHYRIVTVFGKTGLNENSLVMHLECTDNALQCVDNGF